MRTIRAIVDNLKSQRFRDCTRCTYYRIWKIFGRSYLRLDVKPPTWEERIVLFAAFLIDNKLKSATVRSYLSALRSMLAEDGFELNKNLFLIGSLTRACKLKNDRLTVRFPIHNKASNYFIGRNQVYLAVLFEGMLLAGYYGLLRAGEITKSPHSLLAKNVHIGTNKKKLLFVLHTSKTHNAGEEPQTIKIKSTSSTATNKKTLHCLFVGIKNYLEM